MAKEITTPETTSLAYRTMSPRWQVMSDLLGGTEAMRKAGETWLPKYEAEDQIVYDQRISGAVLLNMVERTLDTLSGKPFSEPIKIREETPPEIVALTDDIDLQGNNIHVFCRQWFREGFAKAFAHVLVDFPKLEPREDGQPRTLDDDRKENVRPYWVLIEPEKVLFAQTDVINGRETLTHVRIREISTERVGFGEEIKNRVKVLEPGLVQIWKKKVINGKEKDDEWEIEDEWATGLDYIPMVTFYTNREAPMEGKPPLLDQAYLNVSHWRSTADQRHILTVARFPMLACSGLDKEDSDDVKAGPNVVLWTKNSQGKFYYVEHTGAAIASGRDDLRDLENQMAAYGAEFLKKKPGGQTATARALDSAEATSDLSAMSVVFEDAVAQAFSFTADWLRLRAEDTGGVDVIKEFDVEEQSQADYDFIKSLRERKDISREAVIEFARSRGILPEDFDADEDLEKLLGEIENELGLSQRILDGGLQGEEEETQTGEEDEGTGEELGTGEETQ